MRRSTRKPLLVVAMFLCCSACDKVSDTESANGQVVSLNLRGKIEDRFTCKPIKYDDLYEGLTCSGLDEASSIDLIEVKVSYETATHNIEKSLPVEYATTPRYQPYFKSIDKKNYVVVRQRDFADVSFSAVIPFCIAAIEAPSSRASMQFIGQNAAQLISRSDKAYNWKLDPSQTGKILFATNDDATPSFVLQDGCQIQRSASIDLAGA